MPITSKTFAKSELLGVKLDKLDRYQAMELIESFMQKKSPSLICTVNTEFIMIAQDHNDFSRVLNKRSNANLIDGSGVIWGLALNQSWKPNIAILKQTYVSAQWLIYLIFYPLLILFIRRKIPKVSGSDFVWDICSWAADNHKSIFILGNRYGLDPNAVQKASLEMQTRIFDLKIAGTFATSPDLELSKEAIDSIKKSGADILFCALGSPIQELWLERNLGKTGCKIGLGLGGTFDFIAGVQKRAPKFLQLLGLEWLFRLLRQPKRIKRQTALIKFAFLVLQSRLS